MFKSKKKSKIDELIDVRMDDLIIYDPDNDAEKVQTISRLVEIKEKNKTPLEKIDPNVVIPAAGSLIGIALILFHEKLNVITSKALGFVLRFKA